MARDKFFEFPLSPGLHGHIRVNIENVISIGMYERPSTGGTTWVVDLAFPGIVYSATFPTHDEAHAFMDVWTERVNNL